MIRPEIKQQATVKYKIIMKKHKIKQPTKPLPYVEAIKLLTPREVEVLDLIERGYTNKEIAAELYLSARTVHAHRRNICKKLGLSGRGKIQKWL